MGKRFINSRCTAALAVQIVMAPSDVADVLSVMSPRLPMKLSSIIPLPSSLSIRRSWSIAPDAIWPISRPIPAPLLKYRCCVRCISRRSARPVLSGYALGRAPTACRMRYSICFASIKTWVMRYGWNLVCKPHMTKPCTVLTAVMILPATRTPRVWRVNAG